MKRGFVVLAALLGTFVFSDVARAQGYLKDGFGKCLHIPEETRKNGVQLRTWTCINKAHLKWERVWTQESLSPGGTTKYFSLKNAMTGKCMAVHAGQKHDGAWVVQWDCYSDPNFHWADGSHDQLEHRESGKCLHVASGGQYATVTIRTCFRIPPDRSWDLGRRQPDGSVLFMSGSQKCVRASSDLLKMSNCSVADDALWIVNRISNNLYLSLKNKLTGKCAAVQAGQNRDGTQVILADCGSAIPGTNFQWTRGKYGQLEHRESGKCLSGYSNALVTIRSCVGGTKNFTWSVP